MDASERVCPYCEAPLGRPAIDLRSSGGLAAGLIPHARFTTVMILLVNTALFVATMIASMQKGRDGALYDIDGLTLFSFGAKFGRSVFEGQWWRLVTAGFLHGGLLHILMNSWVLFDLGAQVEEIYGSARLIVFYFTATVLGFLASTWWNPAALSVGASAGIFGLIGAMIAFGTRNQTSLGSAIRGHYLRWALYGLLFGLLPGLRVDNAAHLGGLAAGFATAFAAGEPGEGWLKSETFWKIAAGFCLAVTAICFLKMFLWMTQTQR
ncbi:MAG: rhomboid family intramembrane serine protease [Bryobacteraceae bacterium]|nr:rhomboid family intramembrane serine protease [Bryobacteraceae bacterium]MDW8379207.1 rhomboid family intramembrane serine protease [Bryobacterales bacterium]